MNLSPNNAELEFVRDDYCRRGENFEFLPTADPGIGYFIEPWRNECLMGSEVVPGRPLPVSLDMSDDEIAEQEQGIRDWIRSEAHGLVVADVTKRAPKGWTLKSHTYDADWPENEFGASVLIFAIGPH